MKNSEVANEWFQFGKTDLEAAKFLTKMHPLPIEVICYHCQQSAEKYLKGYIAFNGSSIAKTHDLVILNKTCKNYSDNFRDIDDECIELVAYGVQVRYPYELEVNEQDMKTALICAEKIAKFIEDAINEIK
jgi:HEPN domain-containing protein